MAKIQKQDLIFKKENISEHYDIETKWIAKTKYSEIHLAINKMTKQQRVVKIKTKKVSNNCENIRE